MSDLCGRTDVKKLFIDDVVHGEAGQQRDEEDTWEVAQGGNQDELDSQ